MSTFLMANATVLKLTMHTLDSQTATVFAPSNEGCAPHRALHRAHHVLEYTHHLPMYYALFRYRPGGRG